jgi:5-methylcytosine-specific restriction endonuclease McrA
MSGLQEAQMSEGVQGVNPFISIEKKCTRCQQLKTLDCFNNSSSIKDGKNYVCRDCQSIQNSKRYEQKKDIIIKKVHAYRDKNRNKIRERARDKYSTNEEYKQYCLNYHREHYKNNTKACQEYATTYRNANRELVNKKNADYRKTPIGRFKGLKKDYRKRISRPSTLPQNSVKGELTYLEWTEILDQYGCRCAYCKTEKDITIDHIVPLVKGGTHTKSNVQPLCRSCNSKKGSKLPNSYEAA